MNMKIKGWRILGLLIFMEIIMDAPHTIRSLMGMAQPPHELYYQFAFEIIFLIILLVINRLLLKIPVTFSWSLELAKIKLVLLPGFLFGSASVYRLVQTKPSLYAIIFATAMTITVAVFEEYLWRGMLATYFRQVFKSDFWFIVIPGVLFGLWHISNFFYQSWQMTVDQMIQVAGFGILQMAIMLKSKNLLFPIITHALLDFGGFLSPSTGEITPTVLPYTTAFIYFTFYAGIGLSYLLIDRKNTDEEDK